MAREQCLKDRKVRSQQQLTFSIGPRCGCTPSEAGLRPADLKCYCCSGLQVAATRPALSRLRAAHSTDSDVVLNGIGPNTCRPLLHLAEAALHAPPWVAGAWWVVASRTSGPGVQHTDSTDSAFVVGTGARPGKATPRYRRPAAFRAASMVASGSTNDCGASSRRSAP